MSSDDENDNSEKKVYPKSKLCNDESILNMVRRLSFDPNRDISSPLKYIELPKIREASPIELTDDTLESMKRKQPKEEDLPAIVEEVIDTTKASHTNSDDV